MSPAPTASRNSPTAGVTRVGLFGGSFDPPHLGHIITGQRVAEAIGLDEVWFVVANDPWQKSGSRRITPARTRLLMVDAACSSSRRLDFGAESALSTTLGGSASQTAHPPIAVTKSSEVELEAGGPSYSADTLETLTQRFDDHEFRIIVGSDVAGQLHTWDRAEWLARNARFVAVNRGGDASTPSSGFEIASVSLPPLEISSSEIRQRVALGLPIVPMVLSEVAALIHAHALYKEGDDG